MTDKKNTNTESKTATTAKSVTTPKATAKKAVATLKKKESAPINPPTSSKEVYSVEMLKELDKHNKAVKSGLSGIDKGFEKVTFNLYWIYETGAYKAMGCDGIADYSQKYFDIGKSSAYSFIQLAERFGKRGEDGHMLEVFDEKYKGFSSSKLSLMLDLSDEEIQTLGITSDMSVRDIKKLVKDYFGSLNCIASDTSGSDDSDGTDTEVVEDAEVIGGTFFQFSNYEDYCTKIDAFLVKFDSLLKHIFSEHPDYTLEISYRGTKAGN